MCVGVGVGGWVGGCEPMLTHCVGLRLSQSGRSRACVSVWLRVVYSGPRLMAMRAFAMELPVPFPVARALARIEHMQVHSNRSLDTVGLPVMMLAHIRAVTEQRMMAAVGLSVALMRTHTIIEQHVSYSLWVYQ